MAEKGTLKDPVILGAGGLLIAGGLYLALRGGQGTRLGDTLSFGKVSFKYQGPEASLWICWGLKDGAGDFNNGDNLVAGLWSSGGPMVVNEEAEFKRYVFDPLEDFTKQPEFYLDPDFIDPRNYEPYIWIAIAETANEDAIIRGGLIRGPRIDVKE